MSAIGEKIDQNKYRTEQTRSILYDPGGVEMSQIDVEDRISAAIMDEPQPQPGVLSEVVIMTEQMLQGCGARDAINQVREYREQNQQPTYIYKMDLCDQASGAHRGVAVTVEGEPQGVGDMYKADLFRVSASVNPPVIEVLSFAPPVRVQLNPLQDFSEDQKDQIQTAIADAASLPGYYFQTIDPNSGEPDYAMHFHDIDQTGKLKQLVIHRGDWT